MNLIENSAKIDLYENGFCILKNIIDRKKINFLEKDISQLFKSYALENEAINETCIRLDKVDKPLLYKLYNAIMTFSSFLNISTDCMELSKDILPEGIITSAGNAVMFGLPNQPRLQYDWHQEQSYMLYPDTIHFQFPIFRPASLENGTMSVLKGSNKLGALKYDSFQKSKDSLVNLTVRDIKNYENDLEEVPLIMEIGDVALFTNYTIHRSNHNLSKYVRFSGVSRINSITKVADDKLIDKKSARKSSD